MPNLFEDPTPIIVCGLLAEVVLGIILWQTGRGVLLWIMGAVAALTLLGVIVERLVVTPRERIAMTLDDARRAVVANDLEATLRFLAPAATEERQWVTQIMRRWKFREAAIRELEIDLEPGRDPHRADARLMGVAAFEDRHGEFSHDRYPARLKIKLERVGDRWLITKVLDAEPFRP